MSSRITNRIKHYLKLLLLFSFIVQPHYLHANPAHNDSIATFFVGIINDNYTGSLENGEKGNYIGPDDFLTYSLISHVHYKRWRTSLIYNSLTSRKFDYRYDLISVGVAHSFQYGKMSVQPEFGLVWRGNSKGEVIQNWFHNISGVPEVHLPYLSSGMAVFIGASVSRKIKIVPENDSAVLASMELKIFGNHIPSRLTPLLSYQTEPLYDRTQVELLGGARIYLNEVEYYSEMVRSGPVLGLNTKTRIYEDIYFDFGVSFFPTQSLEVDPLYMEKSFNYIPQINSVLSWNSPGYRLFNFLDY